MKQQVFVIGRDLKELVPFGVAFSGTEFSVTLVQADKVIRRAVALAAELQAWYLLILPGETYEAEAWDALQQLEPATSIVIEDGEDPLIALAHLIAATRWDEAARSADPAAAPLETQQHRG